LTGPDSIGLPRSASVGTVPKKRDESYILGSEESAHVGRTVEAMLARATKSKADLARFMVTSPQVVTDLLKGRRPWTRSRIQDAANFLSAHEVALLPPTLASLSNLGPVGRQIGEILHAMDGLSPEQRRAIVEDVRQRSLDLRRTTSKKSAK
jgi:hypothetical protein